MIILKGKGSNTLIVNGLGYETISKRTVEIVNIVSDIVKSYLDNSNFTFSIILESNINNNINQELTSNINVEGIII